MRGRRGGDALHERVETRYQQVATVRVQEGGSYTRSRIIAPMLVNASLEHGFGVDGPQTTYLAR